MSDPIIYTISFKDVDLKDVGKVGGKNASLGEMINKLTPKGINVPDGFAITASAYWDYLNENNLKHEIDRLLKKIDAHNLTNLGEISSQIKKNILEGNFSVKLQKAISTAYLELCKQTEYQVSVAVRSSATAEDLPTASFAGQQESYLNVVGEDALLLSCKKCFASLFTERAIKYRIDQGFNHMEVALSVGVQQMVRSDKGCSGVAFTIEPETGFNNVVVINGVWGLGENMVKGMVDPDEFILFKPGLIQNKKAVVSKKLGKKQNTMVYANQTNNPEADNTVNLKTSIEKQNEFILTNEEAEILGKWCLAIEQHYGSAMDIEWAKDGLTEKLYIVQARPETVHSNKKDPHLVYHYSLKKKGIKIAEGIALGGKIATGKARILHHPSQMHEFREGEVLVTDFTNPDWDPLMKKAAAVVTNKGGRTSHAAIVARELGTVAVVGTGNATQIIKNGQEITVSCAEGKTGNVYNGALPWEMQTIDTREIKLPKTAVMLILADPEKAFGYSFLPNNGIGLMRMEFVINHAIQIHPMALVKFNELEDKEAQEKIKALTRGYKKKEDYFKDLLSQAVATVAAAFYPKEVIVRMSDFKTNEYANLIGGKQFEPNEENPMLGFRGASRYYHPLYKDGFRLECEAMKIVRDDMGLTNVKLMIPFCRTIDEGKKVIALMKEFGLEKGINGLEIYTMVEIPSNVILADQFSEIFDGFSIGSNDLTQLTLGLDRDSVLVSDLFDENNDSVKRLISQVIKVAKQTGTPIGLCGQAPSDFPDFAQFLVKEGINSISFNPDALIKGIKNINDAENELRKKQQQLVTK